MPFLVADATPADIPAICSIFLMDGEDPSPIMVLSLGSVNRTAINMRQASRIQADLDDTGVKYIIARDQETKKTASFAQWQLPKPDGQDEEDADMSDDEMVRDT